MNVVAEEAQHLTLESVSIEPATPADIDEIVAIEQRAYAYPWSRQVLLGEINDEPFSFVYVARVEHLPVAKAKMIGYNFFWIVADEAHILNIAVDPAYQGTGLGKRLMQFAIAVGAERGAASVLLEVRPSNVVAQSLYRRLGFQQIGVRRNYYGDNHEDAYVMRKWLNRG
ncbi:ribosomal-protein-alanine N-acetyltransferase [candidate division KSB3 bacterium]|uniref:Ribosomal-protein-alanine N-acetyltransferase n=1 Tax=candidate division KSB3 bacterium TaxID=2044937 RepID=A0A9D5JT56_9BACT|nr:ribosomal-protein-alanine N-acetyltransferase [candidate division KSB3 bacterium]MBD3323778.1 ribosomal-protein-alanine N-acetyltransferase [candidate division KSB3 bacterium]